MRFLPKLTIFDLDGTLIEFHHEFLFTQTLEALRQLNYPLVSRRELAERFKNDDFLGFVPSGELPNFQDGFWSCFDDSNQPAPVVIDGALELLRVLSSGGTQSAIATARPAQQQQLTNLLRPTGLLKYIESVSTWADRDWCDKTEQIRELCAAHRVQPSEACMVGDKPSDVLSARSAGVGCTVAVLSSGLHPEVLERCKPDLLLRSVAELSSRLPAAQHSKLISGAVPNT